MRANRRAWYLAAVVGGLFAPAGTTAQGSELRGIVVDSASAAPIPGAELRVRGTRALAVTDADGRFRLRLIESDAILDVNMLGYESALLPLWIPRDPTVVIRLRPNPILLDALEVTASRLAERRAMYTGSVRAVNPDDIVRFRYNNANELVDRLLVPLEECGGRERERACIRWRGKLIRPAVYVDEARRTGGVEALKDWGAFEIHSIEAYDAGRSFRVYTRRYMEHLAKNGIRLMPVQWGIR